MYTVLESFDERGNEYDKFRSASSVAGAKEVCKNDRQAAGRGKVRIIAVRDGDRFLRQQQMSLNEAHACAP
jgi:hypothetical protein